MTDATVATLRASQIRELIPATRSSGLKMETHVSFCDEYDHEVSLLITAGSHTEEVMFDACLPHRSDRKPHAGVAPRHRDPQVHARREGRDGSGPRCEGRTRSSYHVG